MSDHMDAVAPSSELDKVAQMAKDYYDMPTDNTKMGNYYDQMGVELYDAMMDSVNWTEPDEIVNSVLNL